MYENGDSMPKDLFAKWRKHVKEELAELPKIKPTKVSAKCPKCLKDTLEFDPETGMVHCKSCGFEEYISKVVK